MKFSVGDILRPTGCVVVGGLVALATGIGWGVAAGLAVWIGFGAVEFRSFRRWSRSPLGQPRQWTSGWRGTANRLVSSLGGARGRARRLVEELRWLQRTLDTIPDGWIVLQRSGVIEAANRTASNLLGLSRRGRPRNLTALARDPSIVALLEGDVEGGIVELASPVDESRRLELRHLRVDDDRSIVLIRDVTILDRLLTMRQDFIANVSHELRTPLTVVMGYLETLDDDDIDMATLKAMLGKLRAPADRMKALVEDLLTLTRLESSPMPGEDDLELVNVPAMLNSVVNETRQLASKKHRIVLDAEPGVVARGVPAELHSAFMNLVANAIQYSPDGGTVTVRWHRHGDDVRFEVEDHGRGIPRELISRLTERFFRVDVANSRAHGGTGLGLAIVKHILRRHDTQLGVESELGRGSLFYFELPAVRDTALHELDQIVSASDPGPGDGAFQPADSRMSPPQEDPCGTNAR